MKPLAEQSPREVDEQLSVLYDRQQTCYFERVLPAEASLARAEDKAQPYYGAPGSRDRYIAERKSRVEEARAELKAILAEQLPLHQEFDRRGGWTRYYLVVPYRDGHVHRELHCSTCHPTTRYSWLPALSACDEGVMVDEYGDRACAVCFPGVLSHPAYLKAEAARAELERAEAGRVCPESGQHASGHTLRERCRACGLVVPITRTGNLRKHYRPAVKS